MTLRPSESRVRFVAHQRERDLGPCSAPRCVKRATERHHIWSRAQLGEPADYVRDVDTGEVLPNIAPVCSEHHKDLSGRLGGHRARIVWNEERRVFEWHGKGPPRDLDPQPLLGADVADEERLDSHRELRARPELPGGAPVLELRPGKAERTR